MDHTASVTRQGLLIRVRRRDPPVPQAGTVWLRVRDVKGSYAIPYIQSAPDLEIRLDFADPVVTGATVALLREDGTRAALADVTPAQPFARFMGLAPAEYTVRVLGMAADGSVVADDRHEHVGIGTVIAALGDSITEGYHGHGFWRDDLDLTPDAFPANVVSSDRRNYPQYTPTTAVHRPEINCFASWMPRLNDLLAAAWGRPVFIANEGWGGATTAAYLDLTRDPGWQERMRLLQPTVWLIHLGVNDERHKVAVADFAANLRALVEILRRQYAATPGRIVVSTPCYDYWPRAAAMLEAYSREIDALVTAQGLCRGPDFFKAYAVDKERLYGADPVHPNLVGMDLMAELWADALARSCETQRLSGPCAPVGLCPPPRRVSSPP